MRDQIRGNVRINAEGRNLYGFINELHSAGINCFEQYVKGGVFSAVVYRKDLKFLTALGEEYGIEVKSYEYETASSELIRRRSRFGLIIGMVLVLAASLYFSGVVVTIDIQGNERVSDGTILTALEDIGIKKGTPFGQINYIWSENQLRLMVNDLAWVGMHRTGHRLVVEVTELREKPEMVSERIPCNIVAAHDGQIEETSVLDGMLMRKVGDFVYAGEMLVTGVVTDATGHSTLHHAMGSITGIYTDTAGFECQLTQERLSPTGRTDTRRRLELFSLDIPLYFGRNRYAYSSSSVMEREFSAFGRALPISLRTEHLTELDRTVTEFTEEQAREELMRKMYLYEKNFLCDCEILDRSIEETVQDDVMSFTVTYRLKGELGKKMEILAK